MYINSTHASKYALTRNMVALALPWNYQEARLVERGKSIGYEGTKDAVWHSGVYKCEHCLEPQYVAVGELHRKERDAKGNGSKFYLWR